MGSKKDGDGGNNTWTPGLYADALEYLKKNDPTGFEKYYQEQTLVGKHDKLFAKEGTYTADKAALDYLRKNNPEVAAFLDENALGQTIKSVIKEGDKVADSLIQKVSSFFSR